MKHTKSMVLGFFLFISVFSLSAMNLSKGIKNNLTKELFLKIKEKDIRGIRELLGKGVDVNAKDDLGRTALHNVVIFSQKKLGAIIKLLLLYGANPELKTLNGKTPFDLLLRRKFPKDTKENFLVFKEKFLKLLDSNKVDPENTFLFNLLRKKEVKKCIMIIDESEDFKNPGAMFINAQNAFVGNTPIIMSKKLLLSILIYAYSNIESMPKSKESIDDYNSISVYQRFAFVSIIKKKFFSKNWTVYSLKENYKSGTSDYVLLVPKDRNLKMLGFSERLKKDKLIKNIDWKNVNLNKLNREFNKIKDADFNSKKLSF